MRQGPNNRRSRGRGPRKPHVNVKQQTFDSNGPDIRVRGNAYQVLEKYLALARDASAAGDRIASENYLQHAEHYYRLINNSTDGDGNRQRQPAPRPEANGHDAEAQPAVGEAAGGGQDEVAEGTA
jgi:hypothetical protein